MRVDDGLVREWTGRVQIPIDDLFGLVVEHPEYSAADGIHFNEQHGQEVLARQVGAVIAQALAF